MKYFDGQDVRLGDRVRLRDDDGGLVVCLIDTGEFTPEFPAAQWAYLQTGFVAQFPKFGVIHYEEAEEDLVLVARSAAR